MIRPPVHIDEIDDRPYHDAIDEVARRAAHDQGESDARQHLLVRETGRVQRDADERACRDNCDGNRLERKIGRVQDAERGARILNVGEIQEARHHGHALVQGKRPAHNRLRRLIEQHDQRRQP